MLILGIETSCDETGVALLHSERGLLAHAAALPGRRCTRPTAAWCRSWPRATTSAGCCRCCDSVLADAGRTLADVDAIAVTEGPGLAGALLVGASVGHALGYALGKPVIGVHHLEGHLLSPLLAQPAAAPSRSSPCWSRAATRS